jgi:hypothetical protein
MPRQMLNVLLEGLIITAVLMAFLASSAGVQRPTRVSSILPLSHNRSVTV